MNKTDLINSVAESTDLSKKDATKAVDTIFATISDALSKGEAVKLVGFGNFDVRERSERSGVNPKILTELKKQGIDAETAKAQAAITIGASKVPTFKPAKGLKDSVNI